MTFVERFRTGKKSRKIWKYSVCWGKEYEYSNNYGQSAKTGMNKVSVTSETGTIQEKLGLCNNTIGKPACR